MHDGRVTAHSDGPGQGSEFTVRLPVAADAGRRPGRRPTPADGRPRRRQLPRRRILVVDDNRSNATSLGVLLRALGQDVERPTTARRPSSWSRRRRPDVVLLDIGLPGMDGYEVARRCRRGRRTSTRSSWWP